MNHLFGAQGRSCRQLEPVTASKATAAAIDSGTATTPMRLALAIDGSAAADRAVRNHNNQARDPVTNRFGPRFSPMSKEKGCWGVREDSRDAAGRLLTTTVVPAAKKAVPHAPRCESRVAGPDHARPKVPSETATPNRPTRTGTPSTWATWRGWSFLR